MKRIIAAILLIILASTVVIGCGSRGSGPVDIDPDKENEWIVTVNHHRTALRLMDVYNEFHYPSYENIWLIINVSFKNLTDTMSVLDFEERDEIYFIDKDGNVYEMQLRGENIVGELWAYCSGKSTRTGDIYFDIPATVDFTKGKVYFNIAGDKSGPWFYEFSKED